MKFSIRDAQSSDFDEILLILKGYGMVESWMTQDSFENLLQKKNGFYLVAESSEGKIIGVSFGDICGGHHGYLYKGAVHPDQVRKGIRKELLEEMKKRFRGIGVDKLVCQVGKKNIIGKAALRKLGFSDPVVCNWLELSI